MAGDGIKAAIKEFKLPRVSHIAISDELSPFGLYGINSHFNNKSIRVFIVDIGVELVPICVIEDEAKGGD